MKYSERFGKEEIYSINHRDFDNLVKEVYGIDYCFAADEGVSNDTLHEYIINGHIATYERKELEMITEDGDRNYSFMARTFLNNLCAKGLIEKGIYYVKVY